MFIISTFVKLCRYLQNLKGTFIVSLKLGMEVFKSTE